MGREASHGFRSDIQSTSIRDSVALSALASCFSMTGSAQQLVFTRLCTAVMDSFGLLRRFSTGMQAGRLPVPLAQLFICLLVWLASFGAAHTSWSQEDLSLSLFLTTSVSLSPSSLSATGFTTLLMSRSTLSSVPGVASSLTGSSPVVGTQTT